MMKYLNKAFTLVELIVVVTILAILSTIGFVAYNDYLGGTRDTNRISQIKSISDAIQLYNTHNLIPVPDNNVEIRLGTKIIGYQGYAGENILESIEYTGEGLDPKDNNFFTFNITSNRKYFSILSLLEDDGKTKGNITMGSGLFANNYQSRYPFMIGAKIGLLLNDKNIPIQETSNIKLNGFINIEDVGIETYSAIIDNNNIITGNGDGLLPIIPNYDCKRLKDFNPQLESGVYNIDPDGDSLSTRVYCDMTTDGGGWTLSTMLGTQKYNNSDKESTNLFNTANSNSITSLQYDIRDKGNLDMFWNDNYNRDIMIQCITNIDELKGYQQPFIIYNFESLDKSNLTKLNKSGTTFSSKLLSARWKSHNYTLGKNYATGNEDNGIYLTNYDTPGSILYSLGYTLGVGNESNTPVYDSKSPSYYPSFSSGNSMFVDISGDTFCYSATRINISEQK